MDKSLIHNVEDEVRPKLKVNHVKYVSDDPSFMLSKIPKNVIHLEDVGSYLRSMFQNVGEDHISKEFDNIYNQDIKYLKDNNLVKLLFYYEFDNEEWTRIILRRIHDGRFWLADNVVEISINLFHEVTRL